MHPLAAEGPLFAGLGDVTDEAWEKAALALQACLPEGPSRARRIHQLYVPMLVWLMGASARVSGRPAIVGLSAPQGAGKTTLIRTLLPLLADGGIRAVSVSIDDFYRTHTEQLEIAAANPGNRVLEFRGAPGTHDVALGEAALDALLALRDGETTRIPAYDKTAHGGRGDRVPTAEWPQIKGPLDLIVVDGWCLAFRPVPSALLRDPSLLPVNAALRDYARWQSRLDALASFRAASLASIVAWRVEAEERSRSEGRPGLDRSAATDYIRRFLPVYAAFAHTAPPSDDHRLDAMLGPDRLPLSHAATREL